MKKGAIFDLDGTLVYTQNLHIKVWKKLFSKYNISLSEQELKEQSGKKNIAFIEEVLKLRSVRNLDPQELSREKDEIVMTLLEDEPAAVFPGAEQLLKMLRLEKVLLALATSATKKTALLLGKKIISYFDFKVFAGDVRHGKPNPEIFLRAAEGLHLGSDDCIVFEDAGNGVLAAKAGGFFCIAKENGLDQDLSSADVKIKDYKPEEIIRYFQN